MAPPSLARTGDADKAAKMRIIFMFFMTAVSISRLSESIAAWWSCGWSVPVLQAVQGFTGRYFWDSGTFIQSQKRKVRTPYGGTGGNAPPSRKVRGTVEQRECPGH